METTAFPARLARLALLALALVGFVIYPNALYPDAFTKGLYVRALIAVAFAAALWVAVRRREVAFPARTPVLLAVGALFASVLVSMALSPSIFHAFWGEAQRMEGVFGLLHYGALFLVARLLFRRRDWVRYAKLMTVSAPLLVAYAVLQKLAWEFQWQSPLIVNPDRRPGSLFGNPAFLSMFLIFAAGFALWLWHEASSQRWRQAAVVAIAVAFAAIVWLGVRGEVLGFLGGAAVYGGLRAWWQGSRRAKRNFIAALLAAIVLAGALVAFQKQLYLYYPRLIQRMVDLPQEDTFKTRWYSIQSSWKAFLDSPKTVLVGWGPEHFMTGYNKYYDPRHGSIEDAWFDRAHNKLADVLVMEGLLGIAAYLALWAALVGELLGLRKSRRYRMAAIALLALLAAYFLQNLAIFDLPFSYVNFFLVAALVDTLWLDARGKEQVRRSRLAPAASWLRALPPLAGVGIVAVVYFTAVVPLRQSSLYLYYFRTHNGNEMLKNIGKIFRPRTFVQYTLIDDFWRRLKNRNSLRDPQFQPATDFVIQELKWYADHEPYDAAMALRLANAYTERGIGYGGEEDLKQGEYYARRAIALSPTRQESYYQLAFNLQAQGKKEEGVALMRKALALNPGTKKARYTLAINLAIAGHMDEAIEQLERVRKAGWFRGFGDNPQEVFNVIHIYFAAGRKDLIRELLASRGSQVKKDKQYFVMLLRSFIRAHDLEQVLFWARTYGEVYPEFQNDMATVIELAKKGDWETLEQL